MPTQAIALVCPAKECRKPAAFRGTLIVCEAKHGWNVTAEVLRCPKCQALGKHIQLKDADTVACSSCGKPWRIGRITVKDDIECGIVEGSPACDRIMRAVDTAANNIAASGLQEALANGDTTLGEVAGRFSRSLRHKAKE